MKKTFKRILSSLMVAVIILTAAPLSGFVELKLPDWLDFLIMSSATEAVTNSAVIKIFTAEDLQAINNDLSASYILMNDIDLTKVENWEPIGDNLVYYYGTKTGSKFSEESENYFSGHFNGNGFKIIGLNIVSNSYTYRPDYGNSIDGYGLFAHISGATIENLTIENASIDISAKDNYSDANIYENLITFGTLCATAYNSSIVDCRTINGQTTISDEVYAGGMVGFSFKTDLCNIYNALSGNLDGGIMYANDNQILTDGTESIYYSSIKNCINKGNITGSGIAGGFNGYVDNCYNYGEVGHCGIIGNSFQFIEIKNCTNYGDVLRESAGRIGGIIGQTGYYESTIENCINYGKLFVSPIINDTDYIGYTVGGILGDDNYNVIVSDCENYGDITLDLSNALTHGYVAGVASGAICNGVLLNFGDIEVVGASYSLYVAGVVSQLYNNKYSEEFNDVLLNNYGDINVKDCNMIETTNGYLSVGGAYSSIDACKSKTINLGNEGNIFVSGDITFARIGGVGGNYYTYYEETMFNAYNIGNISVTDKTDTESDNLNIGGLFGICSGTNMVLKDSYTITNITTNKTEYGIAEIFNVGNICGYLPKLTSHTIDNCYVYNTTKTIGAGDNLISENIDFSSVIDDFNVFDLENIWILDENGYPKFKDSDGRKIHKHIFNVVTTKPTCTTEGYKTYICSCGDSYTADYVVATGHSWTAATCTSKKTCSACGEISGSALGHSYTSTVTKAATCTTTGIRKYTCSRCSNSYTEAIPAIGHSYVNNSCSLCGHRRSLLSSEIFKFNNSYSSFGYSKYTMYDSDFEKLCNYVRANYYNPTSTINSLQNYRNSSWGGSCYGMSVTVLLDRNGQIAFNENFDSNASTMYDVDKPLDNVAVMSAINYYQIAQKIPFIKNTSHYYYNDDSNWSRGLKNTVETARLGEPFLFCYYWRSGDSAYGHAIVIKYCEQRADGGYDLIAYDNRYPTQDVIVAIDKNFETCVTTYYNYQGKKIEEKPYKIEYTTDYSGFDKIDIDGPYNDFNINYSVNTPSISNVIIEFPATGTVTIENNNGEILTCNSGILTGDMKIISERMIVNSTKFGEADVATVVVEVANGEFFEISSSTNDIDVSILTENTYASANATNANCVVFNENEGVYVLGESMDYDISLTSNMENADMISISGESVSDVSLVYENEAIVASGVDGDCCQVTVFSNIVNAEDKRFISGYDSVKIVSLTEEYGDVDILAVSDDDNIDVSIMIRDEGDNLDTPTGKVSSVSIDDISMSYKNSATITPNVDADSNVDYTVTYSSSNNAVASVDENGRITTNGTGSATITVTVTDEYGNTVTDTCEVNVSYQWWQWIIVIVLFGWIWY